MNLDKMAIISHIIFELIIATCTVITAWPKIKKCFGREKKIYINKLIKDTAHNLEYYGYKNTIIRI